MKTHLAPRNKYFTLQSLLNFFNRSKPKEKSASVEELRKNLNAGEYREKVKLLIKQDLLLRYKEETVEEGLVDFDFELKLRDFPKRNRVKKEEPVNIKRQVKTKIKSPEIFTDEKRQEVWKVQIRVPKWFNNPHQINSKILLAYMELLGENNSVPLYKLEAACRSIKTFQNNYNQMKHFGERNHAKVFEEAGGRVTLWEPVRNFVKKEFISFHNKNRH
jgi:hypothetical protein